MLNESCQRFRDRFTPGRDPDFAGHRQSCERCTTWAAEVEAGSRWSKSTADDDRPLPAALRSRLQSIPRRVVTCRDTGRLYNAARGRAAGRPPQPAVAEHLATCDRCRKLHRILENAFSEIPEPPPPGLVAGLKQIARRGEGRLPRWIAEPRLATAACILMTALLSPVAPQAAALLRGAGGAVGARATSWAETSESRGRRLWSTAATATATSLATSRERLADFAESSQEFLQQTVRIFGSIPLLHDPPPDGGPPDGTADPESE